MKNALSILAASLALTALAGTISPTITDVTLSDRQVTHIHYGNGTEGGELCWQMNTLPYPTPDYWWKLDDNAASTLVSDSASGNHDGVAPVNTDTISIEAPASRGLSRAVLGISMGNILGMSWTTPLSVATWARGNDPGQLFAGNVVGDRSSAGWVFFRWDPMIYFHINAGTGVGDNDLQCYSAAQIPTDGAWHHYGASYDGSGAASGVHFYIDGVACEAVSQFETLTASSATSAPFMLGDTYAGLSATDSSLDDVMVWMSELTPTQTTALYESYGYTPPPPPTVTISFDGGYEGYPDYGSAEYTSGASYGSLPYCYPNAGYENYYFSYWRDADWNYVDAYSTVPASSTTLYAVWSY